MQKYFFIVLIVLVASCSKNSLNEDAAEKLKGKWVVTSMKVVGQETISINLSEVEVEFFDFDDAVGRYNLKYYAFGSVAAETEGSAELTNAGTKLILIEDDTDEKNTSDIETLTESNLKINGTNDNGESIIIIAYKD